MRILGESITEAIDWVQDNLTTTRPLAERTLYSLLGAKQVAETQKGYVLWENEDEEEKHLKHHHNRVHHRSRPRATGKLTPAQKKARQRWKVKHLDYPETASDMDELPGDEDALS